MKNIILFFLASIIFYSCADNNDIMEPAVPGNITLDVRVPSASDIRTRVSDTRAYADGSTVSKLMCYVYNKEAGSDALPMLSQDIPLREYDDYRGGSLSLDLPTGGIYDFVFLATSCPQDDENAKVYYNSRKRTVNVNYGSANDEGIDCFFGVVKDASAAKQLNYKIQLRRPFGQLNIGTKDLSAYNQMASAPLKTVSVTVDGIYSAVNVMDGSVVGEPEKVAFSAAAPPTGQTFPVKDVDYLSMNYLLVNERKDIDVTLTVSNGVNTFDKEYAGAPVQRSHQTNIYGNLLTKTNDFTISVDAAFEGSENINPEDPWCNFDLVLKARSTVSLSVYDGNVITTHYLNNKYKKKYKGENYICLKWSDLGLTKEKHITLQNNNGLFQAVKCDINKLEVTDISDFFLDCENLENVDAIMKWDTSCITNMAGLFKNCIALRSLELKTFDTANVTDMSGMFERCRFLTDLQLLNFDTSHVVNMSHMFEECAFKTLDLAEFDTSGVTDMSYMFYDSKIQKLNCANFDASSVTDMSHMFDHCMYLEYMSNSNIFNTSSVTDMSYMFNGCNKLTMNVWETFDTSNVANMSHMLSGIKKRTIDVSNLNTSKVTDMSGMFQNCGAYDVKQNFDTSNVTDMSYMFNGCTHLRTLILSNFDTSKVTKMNGMFAGCYSTILEINVSSFDTSKVTDMSNMFQGLSVNLDLSNFDTSKVTKMNCMFQDFTGSRIDLSSFDTSNVTEASRMFYQTWKLHNINNPTFDISNITNSREMFAQIDVYKIMTTSSETVQIENILDMFYFASCNHIYLPTVDASGYSLDRLFTGCTKLVNIEGCIINIEESFDLSNSPLNNETAAMIIDGLVNTNDNKTIKFSTVTADSLTEDQLETIRSKGWILN